MLHFSGNKILGFQGLKEMAFHDTLLGWGPALLCPYCQAERRPSWGRHHVNLILCSASHLAQGLSLSRSNKQVLNNPLINPICFAGA